MRDLNLGQDVLLNLVNLSSDYIHSSIFVRHQLYIMDEKTLYQAQSPRIEPKGRRHSNDRMNKQIKTKHNSGKPKRSSTLLSLEGNGSLNYRAAKQSEECTTPFHSTTLLQLQVPFKKYKYIITRQDNRFKGFQRNNNCYSVGVTSRCLWLVGPK